MELGDIMLSEVNQASKASTICSYLCMKAKKLVSQKQRVEQWPREAGKCLEEGWIDREWQTGVRGQLGKRNDF